MSTTVILKQVRCAFPKLFVKEAYKNNPPKYSCRFSFAKDTEMGILNHTVIQDAIATNIIRNVDSIRTPLMDGDQAKWQGDMGNWIVVGSANEPPVILDLDGSEITHDNNDHDKFYTGAIVNAVLDIYYFKAQDGIFCTIKGVQFVEHGEKIEFVADPEEAQHIKNIFMDSTDNVPRSVQIAGDQRDNKPAINYVPVSTDDYDEDIPF